MVSEERFYITSDLKRYCKVLHAQQLDIKTIHLYLPGLGNKQGRITKKYPSRVVSKSDISMLRYEWPEFEDLEPTVALKYISFHPREACFRFLLADGSSFDVRHSDRDDLGGYIDFMVITDTIDNYARSDTAKRGPIIIKVNDNQMVLIRGAYGAEHRDLRAHPVFSNILKEVAVPDKRTVGMFVFPEKAVALTAEAVNSRPRGTLFTTLFQLKNGDYMCDAYLVA